MLHLALLGTVLAAGAADARSAGWLQLRGDRHMSGYAPGRGQMRAAPTEAWHFDIAVWEGYLAVAPGTEPSALDLPFPNQQSPGYLANHGHQWGIGPQHFDLRGDDTLTSMPLNHRFKVAQILPGVPGLQRFEMGDSFSDGGTREQRGWLTAYDDGEPRVVWQTEAFNDTWAPNVLVVDADADGQLDIAVATHYRILVFDGATGATKMQFRYHDFRNYGWFGAANIDADPYPEFAVIADFSMHAEVIDNDGQRLTLQWLHEIQPDPSQSTKIVRVGPLNLLDADGDGGRDLVYNLYDGGGDDQWHLMVVDASTGITRHNYARRYLHGMADLDGDGGVELLVLHTAGEALPTYGPLEIWTLGRDGPDLRWAQARGRFSTRPREEFAAECQHERRRRSAHRHHRRRRWRRPPGLLRRRAGRPARDPAGHRPQQWRAAPALVGARPWQWVGRSDGRSRNRGGAPDPGPPAGTGCHRAGRSERSSRCAAPVE